MTEMAFANMSDLLVDAIPEIRPEYEKELDRWGDEKPGQYIIYEDIFKPYLIALLEKGNSEEILKRIFAQLEKMALSNDKDVRDLLHIGILETLCYDEDLWVRSEWFMGDETLRISREIRDYQAKSSSSPEA